MRLVYFQYSIFIPSMLPYGHQSQQAENVLADSLSEVLDTFNFLL